MLKRCYLSYELYCFFNTIFDKQLKSLAEKFPSLKKDFANLIENLEQNPQQGTPLGRNCYKIPFFITSKGKGKAFPASH